MKQFCYWHIATKENPEGTDCTAHLAEARVFTCIYTIKDIRLEPSYDGKRVYLSISRCPDFKLSEDLEKRFKGLNEQAKLEALQKLK